MQIAGSGMEKIRIVIRDKHRGSATLHTGVSEKNKNRLWLPYPTIGDKLASLCECIFDVNVQNQIQNNCTVSGSDQENLYKYLQIFLLNGPIHLFLPNENLEKFLQQSRSGHLKFATSLVGRF
jgi:hypothetical protein